tara:strand:- start:3157 stop:3657 length:501 start_codon:yes stop_codon:yes gene_type:complete
MSILEENLMKKNNIILSLIILAVLTRLLPHPPNVAPITGIALFAGNKFDNKWIGLILPIICMLISDLFLGFSSITLFVYLAFILISYIGMTSKINNTTILKSSTLFFFITNFGVWLLGYPLTIQGFITCYTLALPFFVNTIIGDLFFTYSLSFSFERVKERYLVSA